MDLNLYLTFVLVSLGIIVIPGPNVLLIISTSAVYGRTRGLQTVAGTSVAMAMQLIVVVSGASFLALFMSVGLTLLKWLGVFYLLYLAFRCFCSIASRQEPMPALTPSVSFARGFLVSLTNPKTILFFITFLPQFISPDYSHGWQLAVLACTFLCLALCINSLYAVLSFKLTRAILKKSYAGIKNLALGLIYVALALWLSFSRRII